MRYSSIDILRTFAIWLMIIVHFLENLAGSLWTPAGFGAPLFSFLVGVSYRLWLRAREAKGVSESEISIITIRRGLFLFGIGMAFNVLVWLPADTYNWDVLTLIGTGMILLNIARTVPPFVTVFFCIVAFLLAPFLRAMANYPAYWTESYFAGELTFSDVFIGYFANGYFPFFPWIIYPLAGYITGLHFFRDADEPPAPVWKTFLLGAAFMATSVLMRVIGAHAPAPISTHVFKGWTMFPASMEYVSGTLGIALMAFSLGHAWIDRKPRIANHWFLKKYATTFSKYSFSIYLLHHMVHIWPLWFFGTATTDDTTHYWRQAMSIELSMVLAFVFVVFCFFLFRWIDRNNIGCVESWMRKLCG